MTVNLLLNYQNMELKEFIKIFKQRKKAFLLLFVVIVFGGMTIYFFIPEKNKAILSIDIARTVGGTDMQEYRYDQFYRLEADDRFAGTIVQWLDDPNVQKSIENEVNSEISKEELSKIKGSLKAKKKSANFIQVEFVVSKKEEAVPFAKSIKKVLDSKVEKLNKDVDDERWFRLIFSGPSVLKEKMALQTILVLLFALGSGISVFGVLAMHYLQEDDQNENRD